MRVKLTEGVPTSNLLKPLDNPAAEAVKRVLNLYSSTEGNTLRKIVDASSSISNLKRDMDRGYVPFVGKKNSAGDISKWRNSIQLVIESLASPKVGRERQAIALACLRDVIAPKKTLKTTYQEDLEECQTQLDILYIAAQR